MTSGNENFTAIRFTAQKHKLDNPFNKQSITSKQTPPVQTSLTADPLPWLTGTFHNFYASGTPFVIPAGSLNFAVTFTGQVTTSAAGTINLGLSSTLNSAPTSTFVLFAVGAGDVSFSESVTVYLGPFDVDMYPVFQISGMNITAITNTPTLQVKYMSM